ncbi:hypothetical protein [Desulfolutivibrio sp.]|uniref:hypothetical protein n=1 Tax=Desulfolutivibrio sp. TaxID=2773296 RepID=UPI002F96C6C3
MADEQNVTSDDTGEGQNQGSNEHANPGDSGGKFIPKSRFDEVNQKFKEAKETLQAVVDELKADLPEEMQDLVPDLPPAETIKWLRLAQKKGVFGGKETPQSGPDAKRPGGKSTPDFDTMTPGELISMGLQQR